MTSIRRILAGVMISAGVVVGAEALEVPKTSADVAQGVNWLCGQGRFIEGQEVCTVWLNAHPDDREILFSEAHLLTVEASAQSDPAAAMTLRKKAFADATLARKLGNTNPLIDIMLGSLDAEGRDLGDPRQYSAVPAAAAAMQEGERAFARRDLRAALDCYSRALRLDPRSYSAALYTGDVYFNERKYDEAIVWFKKAIAIDPHRETAHRYLADTYTKLQKWQLARAAYISAVIAEPYNRLPREMLTRLAPGPDRKLRVPHVDVPMVKVPAAAEKDVDIYLRPADVDPLVWAYTMGRAKWLTEERKNFFPAEMKPRHSVYEECAGLRVLIAIAAENGGTAETKYAPSIAALRELDQAGLLEAFVLLDRTDDGIAVDYPAYRALHRAELVRYINEVWLTRPAASDATATAQKLPAPPRARK